MDQTSINDDSQIHFNKAELNLSLDCVIFTIKDDQLKVLLTKLSPESNWMLPGGFIYKDEEADLAADRILFHRTGVKNIYLQQFKIFSEPNRFSFKSLYENVDSEGLKKIELSLLPDRVISIGYFALVNFISLHLTGGLFKEEAYWADVKEIPDLVFDHNDIISEALLALRKELFFRPIAYKLLPEKFTMPELQKLHEIILDKTLERSSFQKRMLRLNIYKRLEERREGVAHKRPYLYCFDQDKYNEALNQGLRFGI
jgi:ADP-ribose pyrophosphatase YjhB (NUDIX family)